MIKFIDFVLNDDRFNGVFVTSPCFIVIMSVKLPKSPFGTLEISQSTLNGKIMCRSFSKEGLYFREGIYFS